MQYRRIMMNWRTLLLLGVSMLVVVLALFADPVAQDPGYHRFADGRTLFGIPNFMNVFSNIGFLVVGVLGVKVITGVVAIRSEPRVILLLLFIGIVATAFGSGWYHWQPSNESLVWDRLGMVIGFMALVALIISEYGSARAAGRLLWPLMLVGAISVLYWSHTESLGRGDLRLYAMVQFVPILLIPLVLLMYPERSRLTLYFWWLIGFYVASKVAEHFDFEIYQLGQLLSGHSLKHILAALAPASLLLGLMRQEHVARDQ